MAIPTRPEVTEMINRKLAEDPAWRQQLLADPRAALSELVGMDIPEAVRIEVHEESFTSLHVVLPAVAPDGELSEDDLELVAGGGACWDNCGCSI